MTLSQDSFHKMVTEQDPEGAAEAKPQMLLCPMAGPPSPAQTVRPLDSSLWLGLDEGRELCTQVYTESLGQPTWNC